MGEALYSERKGRLMREPDRKVRSRRTGEEMNAAILFTANCICAMCGSVCRKEDTGGSFAVGTDP